MKPKTVVLMVVAVVCGLAASYMTSLLLAQRSNAPAAEEEKVQVLVAKQKIPVGTYIKDPEKYFIFKPYTKGEEPKKAIRAMEQVKDRRLNKPLNEEQFVTPDDLLDPKHAGIEHQVPAGMRAIALKVNPASVVAGFVLPNSRVDVVCTVRGGENSFTQTILQNMLVLASDMNYIRDGEKQAQMSSTVTLAAKPEDAQKLRLAEAVGELSLTLRNTDDDEVAKTKLARPTDVLKSTDASVSAATEDGTGGAGGAAPLGSVPDVPATKAADGTAAARGSEKEPEAPKPPKTITQVLYNGEGMTKTVFVVNEDGNMTTQVEKVGGERPEKKAADKDKAKADDEDKAKADDEEKGGAKDNGGAKDKADGKKNGDKEPAGKKSDGAK